MSLVTKPIPGYPGYVASTEGEIIGPRGPMRGDVVKGGYRRVQIGDKHLLVARLVALAFHGPVPDGQEVNHRNGDTADNRPLNLEYTTPSGNVRHSIDTLGRQRAKGTRNAASRLTDQIVLEMRAAHAAGMSAAEVGRLFGVDTTHAWRICTRRAWRHVP